MRKYLTLSEVIALREAAHRTSKRYKHRNWMLLLVCYRHALRVSELINLRWTQIDLDARTIYIERVKNSKPSMQLLEPDEHEGLCELKRLTPVESEYVFVSQAGQRLSVSSVAKLLDKAATDAGFTFKVHPHMLRHAKGFSLVNSDKNYNLRLIQDFLGHRNIQHTVLYTELDANRLRTLSGD